MDRAFGELFSVLSVPISNNIEAKNIRPDKDLAICRDWN